MIPDVESDYGLRMLDRSAVPSRQFDSFDKSSILRDPACPDEHSPAFAGRIELVVAAELAVELAAVLAAGLASQLAVALDSKRSTWQCSVAYCSALPGLFAVEVVVRRPHERIEHAFWAMCWIVMRSVD